MPVDIYEKIMESLQDKGVKFIVDTTGESLLKVLKYKPFLIKPNHHELGDLFNVKLKGNDEIIEYAKKLKDMGARNVLISMAGDGAVLLTEDGQRFESMPPKGKVVNSVGAGDSMVAGFLAGYMEQHDYAKAFYTGLCAGSASAFSEELATSDEVHALLHSIGR